MERQKRTKQLGKLEGRLLIFGGVYSNLQALEALKRVAEEYNIPAGSIICTGDIVGYCAQPEECVKLIREWGLHSIAGNVEIQLREGKDDCGCDFTEESRCDIFSRNWYTYAKRNLKKESLEWMNTLPDFLSFEYNSKKIAVMHGDYFNTSEFIFKSTPWDKKAENFSATGADVIISGHCGLPFSDAHKDKLWLNAGVIGMPANDGDVRVWYLLLDDESGVAYSFKRLPYNNRLASGLMIENKLPEQYARTLLNGIWDNCEILPDTETEAQGKEINI